MHVLDLVAGSLSCAALCVATAYLDIRAFFAERRIGVTCVFRQGAALLFFAANGAAGLALLAWAIADPQGPLGHLLPGESAIAAGLAIGLSVPALIRSKWFSIRSGDTTAPAGFETLYEWARKEVLHCVHVNAIHLKRRVASAEATRLAGSVAVPDQVHQRVREEAALFRNAKELEELDQEFANIARFFADQPASKEHLEALFLWAMNNSGIAFVQRCLKELA